MFALPDKPLKCEFLLKGLKGKSTSFPSINEISNL